MKYKKNKKLNILNDNSGSTMVETLVAFVILLVVLAALYGMVRFSTNLRMRAVDSADVRNSFCKEIYKSAGVIKTDVKCTNYVGKFSKTDGTGTTMFTLKPSSKTDNSNFYTGEKPGYYDRLFNSLRIPCIDATGYVSTDERIANENLPTPRIICFEYNKTGSNNSGS